jgi:hypothetical protein
MGYTAHRLTNVSDLYLKFFATILALVVHAFTVRRIIIYHGLFATVWTLIPHAPQRPLEWHNFHQNTPPISSSVGGGFGIAISL